MMLSADAVHTMGLIDLRVCRAINRARGKVRARSEKDPRRTEVSLVRFWNKWSNVSALGIAVAVSYFVILLSVSAYLLSEMHRTRIHTVRDVKQLVEADVNDLGSRTDRAIDSLKGAQRENTTSVQRLGTIVHALADRLVAAETAYGASSTEIAAIGPALKAMRNDLTGLRSWIDTKDAGEGDPVLSLFDGVGPYRKNGLFEEYGANLRERRSGAIKVSEADLEITNDEAWAIWSPDFSPARDATHLLMDFEEFPDAGIITVGFILDDGQAISFSYDTGQWTSADPGVPASIAPESLAKPAISARQEPLTRSGRQLIATLPDDVRQRLRDQENSVAHWFLRIRGASGRTLRVRTLALVAPRSHPTEAQVTLSGSVRSLDLPHGAEIELVDEHGRRRREALGSDGRFTFTDVDARTPVSLRVRHREFLHFSTLGRWFVPAFSRRDVVVGPPRTYVNVDGHAPDPKTAQQIYARRTSPYAAIYEPHTRIYWPGAGKVQEFASTTFINNVGYVDRDRFRDNPDNCFRIGTLGGSESVALQVEPMQKYNILLEEDLGIALDRCVEVFSAGRDNGDLGANYPRIRDYFSNFDLHTILVSTMPANVSTLSATMLKDGVGWDQENSPLDSFSFDDSGKLSFRPFSPDWPVFTTKPTFPEYIKGIPFGFTLGVSFDNMPAEGKDAFHHLSAILQYISERYPDQKLVLQTGLDQAQCRSYCQVSLIVDGHPIPAGAKVFQNNLDVFCVQQHIACIAPEFSDAYAHPETYLTFVYDGHYSPRGHQWLAQQLADRLVQTLGAKAAGQ